ncbi:MAG: hypothetical protein AB7I18_10305 [Candidatus Berkiella sp.]
MLAYAKPKIVMLDDDASFLDVAAYFLEKNLGNDALIAKFPFSTQYINHVQNHCYLHDTSESILRTFYSSDKSKEKVEQTLQDLSDLPAMLVIDHQLRNEETNGIQISQMIKQYIPHSFIILLTAEVSTDKALDLHNNDVIDLFVRKDAANPMDVVLKHLNKQIEKMKAVFNFDPEDAFGFETTLENEHYINCRDDLLYELDYKAYLTLSASGDIAVLDMDNKITHYSYDNKAFSRDG